MSSDYATQLDVQNRALQHCQMHRIATLTDSNANAKETTFLYDKVRAAELRNNTWRFAIRRVILRALGSTSLLWTPPTYAAGTTYSEGSVVVDSAGIWWQSKVTSNTGNTPQPGANWRRYFGPDTMVAFDATAGVSYQTGELTTTGGVVYLSLVSSNTDTPPSSNWLAVNGTTITLKILYPIGAGPSNDDLTRNAFRLPHGYLRQAPTDPRAGINPYLGAPRGPTATDWVFEGDYIVTFEAGPLMLRFVADFADVNEMDPMFCEMLAARIAEEAAPTLCKDMPVSDRNLIVSNVRAHYKSERWKAIGVNGIETGPTEAVEDDYITCRL